jgi:hypothetical protein
VISYLLWVQDWALEMGVCILWEAPPFAGHHGGLHAQALVRAAQHAFSGNPVGTRASPRQRDAAGATAEEARGTLA